MHLQSFCSWRMKNFLEVNKLLLVWKKISASVSLSDISLLFLEYKMDCDLQKQFALQRNPFYQLELDI